MCFLIISSFVISNGLDSIKKSRILTNGMSPKNCTNIDFSCMLFTLVRWQKIGRWVYTDKRDAVKGLPSHLVGKGLELVEEMVKDGFLMEHKNKACVSINLEKKDEVNRLRSLFLEKKFAKQIRRF